MRSWRFRYSLLSLLLISTIAWAADPFSAYDAPSSRGIKLPADFNGWHFNDKTDSSQGWYHLIHLKNGGWVTVLYTVGNLGPYKLSPSIAVLYLDPNGTKYRCDAQWSDSKYFTRPTDGKYWIGVNHSFFGGVYPNFYAKVKDGGCTGDLTFRATTPSFTQGSGVASFYADKSATWRMIQIAPRATAKGYVQFKEGRVEVEGDAYLEEVSGDLAIPAMSDRWYVMHAFSGPYAINLFDIVVDRKRFGQGHVRTLLVARGNQIVMGTTQFRYEPQGGKKDSASGILVPESFALSARDGNVTLTGTVVTSKVMDSLDVLSQAPRFIRLFGGLIHGTPWQYRIAANVDLVLKEGETETPIKGMAFEEIHYYDR